MTLTFAQKNHILLFQKEELNGHYTYLEMSLISLGVALFSFLIGNLVRHVFGINV